MSEFKEKVVLVTGVASGIGLAQAKIFLANGAKVFGVDCQEMPENLADSPRFVYFQGDVSDNQVCKQAVEKCCQHFGKVDILLNTAGVLDNYATIAETSIDQWHQVLRTNLDSMFYFCKGRNVFFRFCAARPAAVIPRFRQAPGGRFRPHPVRSRRRSRIRAGD